MNFVVIGASRGLGFSLVEQLLKEKHRVAAGIIKMNPLLADLKNRHSGQLLLIEVDITNEESVKAAASQSSEFLGAIDGLCVTAGVLLDGDRVNRLHEVDIDELRYTFEVNTIGPILASKYFYLYMAEGSNVFIVTSEGTGLMNCGTWVPAYALSKTAATKISGILNASVSNVNFFSVHPGRMNTDMGRTTAQIEPDVSAAGFLKLMTGQTPLSRDKWYIDYEGKIMDA